MEPVDIKTSNLLLKCHGQIIFIEVLEVICMPFLYMHSNGIAYFSVHINLLYAVTISIQRSPREPISEFSR